MSSGNSQLVGDSGKVRSVVTRTEQEINLSVKGALWQDPWPSVGSSVMVTPCPQGDAQQHVKESVSASVGCSNKLPLPSWLKQHKFILSQSWRPEVWNEFLCTEISHQGSVFSGGSRGESTLCLVQLLVAAMFLGLGPLHSSVFFCLHVALSSSVWVKSPSASLIRMQAIAFRAHVDHPG